MVLAGKLKLHAHWILQKHSTVISALNIVEEALKIQPMGAVFLHTKMNAFTATAHSQVHEKYT